MSQTKPLDSRSYPHVKASSVGALPSDMQKLLEQAAPASASAALNALRRAFPDSPLDERVRACEAYARNFRL